MTRRYSLCCTRRVTLTIIVFSILALVTTPVTSWRSWRAGAGAAADSLAIGFPQFTLAKQSLDAGQILARRAQLGDGLGLSGRELKAQPEDLLGQLALPFVQFRRILIAQFLDSLGHQSAPARLTKRVRIGSLWAASSMASCAVARSTPAISNITRPGFTTATQRSGAPLPLPMRVSAGFLVNGLSGKMRIHSFPPRLMNRVMATREASICRSVIQAGSRAFRPYSPNERSLPRQAFPARRPRCCLRYFTFFGINIVFFPQTLWRIFRPRLYGHCLRFRLLDSALGNVFPLVNPALHANHAVGGVRLGRAVVNVGAQGLQRQPALQIPFLAGDFRAVQASGNADLDSLAAEAQRGIDGLAHGPAKGDALFELQRDRFGDERGIEFRPVHFLDVDMHFALGALLDFALELVDFRAFTSDDNAGARGEEANDQLVRGALDVDRADARRFQAVLQRFPQLHVFVQEVGVIAVGVPPRLPGLVVAESKSVWMCLLSQGVSPPLLLRRLSGRLFLSGEGLASFLDGSGHALLRFGFRRGRGDAVLRGDVMLGHSHDDVRRAALVAERAANR